MDSTDSSKKLPSKIQDPSENNLKEHNQISGFMVSKIKERTFFLPSLYRHKGRQEVNEVLWFYLICMTTFWGYSLVISFLPRSNDKLPCWLLLPRKGKGIFSVSSVWVYRDDGQWERKCPSGEECLSSDLFIVPGGGRLYLCSGGFFLDSDHTIMDNIKHLYFHVLLFEEIFLHRKSTRLWDGTMNGNNFLGFITDWVGLFSDD